MVLTYSTTTDQASISLISRCRRKIEDIFHKKNTIICPAPNILLTEVCVTVTFPLPWANPVQDSITLVPHGSFALFSTWFPHPNHFSGFCMLQNRHIKATILALSSFHSAILTSYELQPARSLSENEEVPTHLHNMNKYAKQGLLSCLCVWAYRSVVCLRGKLVSFREQVNSPTSMLRMS